jgi:DNA-directed RNA polymerase specialized sigma24 family protein
VKGPRAYLFRIATNLWIDQMRRRQLITSSLSGRRFLDWRAVDPGS